MGLLLLSSTFGTSVDPAPSDLRDGHGELLLMPFCVCRVGTNEKDVIVITPNELESSPTLVQGKVVLSLNDSMSVRKITLRLYGVVSVA